MNAPTNQPDRITAAELRQEFESLHAELAQLRADLETIRAGLHTAAQPAASPTIQEMTADTLSLDYVDGKPLFKLKGDNYRKFGVRVWPEVLDTLGIDPAAQQPGINTLAPIRVRVLMRTNDAGQVVPFKIIGPA